MALSRISSFASNSLVTSRLLQLQANLHEKEVQVASEKKSQTYSGIASDSERLVNIENSVTRLDRYITTNTTASIRVDTAQNIISGIQGEGEGTRSGGIRGLIDDFRGHLETFQSGLNTYTTDLTPNDVDNLQVRTDAIQQRAFEALKSIKDFLNESVNGEFLFAGTRTDTQPVELETDSLNAFQTKYDGVGRLYPPTREAHVETELTTDSATTGAITTVSNNGGTPNDYTDDTGTITAANGTGLGSIPVGAQITINGGTNDGRTVTVVANDGATIDFAGTIDYTGSGGSETINVAVPEDVSSEGANPNVTLSVEGYYKGDKQARTQRLSDTDSFDFEVNAADPAFEKAIRAIGIIAQGGWGTNNAPQEGSLARNPERLDQALWLLSASETLDTTGTPPFGTADTTGDNRNHLDQLELDLGFHQVRISDTNDRHKDLMAFYDDRIADYENIDNLEVITEMLDESRALESSYQVLSRVRQLSLSNFL